MSEFAIKDTARITNLRRESFRGSMTTRDVRDRERQAVHLLGEKGAMTASQMARELKFGTSAGATGLLVRLIKRGLIMKTGHAYHLKGQSAQLNINYTTNLDGEGQGFFEGKSKLHALRRFLRDHQDEPFSAQQIADKVGYAASSAVGSALQTMMSRSILRRYRAPEDKGWAWRYQYIPDELSGITTIKPEPEVEPEPVATEPVADTEAVIEETIPDAPAPTEAEQPTSLSPGADFIEAYAKEFFWQTGSKDARELVLWLRERELAGHNG
jgi:predicted transcriptional regulator